jgi:chromosome segregation ATPase
MNEGLPAMSGIDYKKEYEREQERLKRLYDAYEIQEKEFQAAKEKITKLEESITEKDRVIRSLREVMSARDAENRELHIELTTLRSEKATWDPRLKELEADMRLEQDRFSKLFKLAMDLDAELKESQSQIDARDRWYKKNILVMSNIKRAIDDYDKMVTDASGSNPAQAIEGELSRLKGTTGPMKKD